MGGGGGAKNTNATHLSADSVAQHTKFYKNEDIPLTISGSLMRTRTKTSNDYEQPFDQYDSNESNDDNCGGVGGGGDGDDDGDGDSDYTYSNPHSTNPTIIHYSTMSSNARDYFRKTAGHLHRGVNNNSNSMTASTTNCYRWHNQSDEVVLHSLRNNSMTIAAPTKAKVKVNAMTMHPNHRSYNYSDRRELQHKQQQQQQHHQQPKHHQHQQQQQQNHINNNCIVSNNKKQSIMIQNTHNNQKYVDQNNGNQYPPRLYH